MQNCVQLHHIALIETVLSHEVGMVDDRKVGNLPTTSEDSVKTHPAVSNHSWIDIFELDNFCGSVKRHNNRNNLDHLSL